MRIGRLKNKLAVYTNSNAFDEFGERELNKIKVLETSFDISQIENSDEILSEHINYISRYKCACRYNRLIKNGQFLDIDGQLHRISGVVHDFSSRRYTKFICVLVEGENG